MEKKMLVSAIDFGTTFSGYAFSFRHDLEMNPPRIRTNTAWTSRELGMSWKIPTAVLLDSDQKFHSFGFEAEDKYCELAKKDEHAAWYFYKRFKMFLYNQECNLDLELYRRVKKGYLQSRTLQRDSMIPDATGKMMPAMSIFSVAIRYLKDHLLCLLAQDGIDVRPDDILWVLTVPAIWDEAARQFMEEAAVEAGIPSNQLKLVLESDAASIYCKTVVMARPFKPGTRLLVLDIGGGTVDVTVHEVTEDGKLKELQKASIWGGTQADDSYFEIFNKIFGKELMEEFKHEHKSGDLEMQQDFERKKHTVTGVCQPVFMKVSASFKNFVECKTGKSLQELVKQAGKDETIKFKMDRVQFQGQEIRELFEPIIQRIIFHIKEVIKSDKMQRIDKILTVGGFSKCCLVRHAIQEAFPELNFVTPDEPGPAVLIGAVIFGHSMEESVARFTFGVAVQGHYRKGYHPENQRDQIDGQIFCNNLFSKLIEIDFDTMFADRVKKNYRIPDKNKPLEVAIYVSTKPYPLMVMENDCRRLGEVRLSTPIGGWRKKASVDVELAFRDI